MPLLPVQEAEVAAEGFERSNAGLAMTAPWRVTARYVGLPERFVLAVGWTEEIVLMYAFAHKRTLETEGPLDGSGPKTVAKMWLERWTWDRGWRSAT